MAEIIQIKSLDHVYADGTQALKGISFGIETGEFVAVLGQNGSGKTTLLKHINRLLTPSNGEVFLKGQNLAGLAEGEIFSKIGMIFQDSDDQLFAASVEEDVAYGPTNLGLPEGEVRERVAASLALTGMEWARTKAIHQLSHGERRRVSIAGVLAMSPEVLLLDEPTSDLDPVGVHDIMKILRALNRERGITMIMATHAVDLVPTFMNRCVVLNRGSVLAQGTPRDVFTNLKLLAQSRLELPKVAELMLSLEREGVFRFEELPLTIGEAKEALLSTLPPKGDNGGKP